MLSKFLKTQARRKHGSIVRYIGAVNRNLCGITDLIVDVPPSSVILYIPVYKTFEFSFVRYYYYLLNRMHLQGTWMPAHLPMILEGQKSNLPNFSTLSKNGVLILGKDSGKDYY